MHCQTPKRKEKTFRGGKASLGYFTILLRSKALLQSVIQRGRFKKDCCYDTDLSAIRAQLLGD